MKSRGSGIAGNPVLIGAATILVVLVAVFLAYNANKGLPFVPTYVLKAEVPSAANLVVGNDVRIGGSRVGFVGDIDARRRDDGTTVAVLTLTLEKSVAPLPRDSTLIVRPRSALGLKYVEITRGRDGRGYADGSHDPAERRHAGSGRVRRVPQHVRRRHARRGGREHRRLRRRVRGPRGVDQHGDRRLPAAAARHHPGRPEPLLAPYRPAPLVPLAGSHGGDRRPRRRGAGRAVREPRHHVPRPARGRAAVHPGLDHRRRSRTRRRDPFVPDPATVPAQHRAAVRGAAAGRGRAAHVRADDRRRTRGGHRGVPAHAGVQPPAGRAARRACRRSPRTRWCRAGCAPPPPRSSP